MKFSMPKERINGHQRVRLLKLTSKMNLSLDLQLKIAKIIGQLNPNEREAKAKEIVEMIQDCKTEQEVIQVLKLEQ